MIVNDIADECPNDEVEQTKSERTENTENYVEPHIARVEEEQKHIGNRSHNSRNDANLFFTELSRKRNSCRSERERGNKACRIDDGKTHRVVEIVLEYVVVDGLIEHLCAKEGDVNDHDTDQRTVGKERLNGLTEGYAFLLGIVNGDTLGTHLVTNQIATCRCNRKDQSNDGERACISDLCSIIKRGIKEHRHNNANENLRNERANTAECGKRCTVICFRTHNRCHRSVRNVDGGIAYATPKQIGYEHINNAHPHLCVNYSHLIHQKACKRYGAAHTNEPRLELATLACLYLVGNSAHRRVGECINNTCNKEHRTYKSCIDMQNVRVEYGEEHTCHNEC